MGSKTHFSNADKFEVSKKNSQICLTLRIYVLMGSLVSPTRILDRLFLGSMEDAEALLRANPNQISTVITLCREPVRHRVLGIRYVHLPVRDGRAIAIARLSAILSSIEEGIVNGVVLIHCGAGMSRSPAVVAAYLDHIGFRTFEQALKYLEELRPVVAPSRALVQSIERELTNSWNVEVYP